MLSKPPKSLKLPVNAFLVGVILGIIAQVLRQMQGTLMYLGASTAPWIMAGFLLAVLASRRVYTQRKAILLATGNVAVYIFAWLISYHLLFVIRESVSLDAGWRQAVPWLILAVPVSPILGLMAAMSHKDDLVGDGCLALPVALSIPEALMYMKEDWLTGIAVITPIAILAILMIYVVKKERRVHMLMILSVLVTMGALGIVLYPLVWFLLLGRY